MTAQTTIYRVQHGDDNPFFMLRRATAQDSRLSFEARGVLTYLLSKPDNWETKRSDLMREGSCGRDRINRIISELENFGYIQYRRRRDDSNKFTESEYAIFESPRPRTEKPHTENTYAENPRTEKPHTENPQHTYTESTYTDSVSSHEETIDGQPDGSRSQTPDEPKRKFAVGQQVFYVQEKQPGAITILEGVIERHTPKKAWVTFQGGAKKCLMESSLSDKRPALERSTDRLQDAILYHVMRIGKEQPVGKKTMQEVNTIRTELLTAFPGLTPREFHYACLQRDKAFLPSNPAKLVSLVGKYRESQGKQADAPAFGPDAAHLGPTDPNCPICDGAGVVQSSARVGEPGYGETAPCVCRKAIQQERVS